MIDDEVLNNGQSSPPPPAPNGENSTNSFQPPENQQRQYQDTSWNPFCTPIIQHQQQQQHETHQHLSSMNPFHADLMKQQVHTIPIAMPMQMQMAVYVVAQPIAAI